jgi:RNA recognition motif-containing protein
VSHSHFQTVKPKSVPSRQEKGNMLANRFPALISAEAAQHNENASNDYNSQASQQNNLMHGSSNQEKVQMSRAYGQPSNQRMYPGSFEPRQNTIEPIETPVITDANLYIKNIDYDISDETLYNVFSKLGEITSHHIVRDTMKRSRGFGFM